MKITELEKFNTNTENETYNKTASDFNEIIDMCHQYGLDEYNTVISLALTGIKERFVFSLFYGENKARREGDEELKKYKIEFKKYYEMNDIISELKDE